MITFLFLQCSKQISIDEMCTVGNVKNGVKGKTTPLKGLSTKNYF